MPTKRAPFKRFLGFVFYSIAGVLCLSLYACTGTADVTPRKIKSPQNIPFFIEMGGFRCLAYSPDGRHMATGDSLGRLILWDARSGRQLWIRQLKKADAEEVENVTFCPVANHLTAVTTFSGATVWHTENGSQIGAMKVPTLPYASVAYSPDGGILALAEEQDIGLYKVPQYKKIGRLSGYESPAAALSISASGRWLVSGHNNGDVRLWEMATGRMQRLLTGHRQIVGSVGISPDERYIFSGDRTFLAGRWPGSIFVWERSTGESLYHLELSGSIYSLAVHPSNKWIALATRDNELSVWAYPVLDPTGLIFIRSQPVFGLAYSPDGGILASAGDDGWIKRWDILNRKQIHPPDTP